MKTPMTEQSVKPSAKNGEGNSPPIKPPRGLYGTAALMGFSNSTIQSFLRPFAVLIGLSFGEVGFMTAANNFSSTTLQIGWGRLSDKYGRRLFILAGNLVCGILMASFLLPHNPQSFIMVSALWAVFWSMVQPSWNALLGDYTELKTRGSVLGLVGSISQSFSLVAMASAALINLTMAVGSGASSFVLPFLIAAIAGVAAGLLALFVKEKPRSKTDKDNPSNVSVIAPFRNSRFQRFIVLEAMNNAGMAFAWPLFPFVTINVIHATIFQISIIHAVNMLTASLAQRRLGRLIDRVGRKPILFTSRISFFAYPLAYAFATDWVQLVMVDACMGIFMAAWSVSLTTYILDLAPEGQRAAYVACSNTLAGIGSTVGSFFGGVFTSMLLGSMNFYQALFAGLIVSSILRVVTSIGFVRIEETLPKEKRRV